MLEDTLLCSLLLCLFYKALGPIEWFLVGPILDEIVEEKIPETLKGCPQYSLLSLPVRSLQVTPFNQGTYFFLFFSYITLVNLGIVWEKNAPSTEFPRVFCSRNGLLQLGVVLVMESFTFSLLKMLRHYTCFLYIHCILLQILKYIFVWNSLPAGLCSSFLANGC